MVVDSIGVEHNDCRGKKNLQEPDCEVGHIDDNNIAITSGKHDDDLMLMWMESVGRRARTRMRVKV